MLFTSREGVKIIDLNTVIINKPKEIASNGIYPPFNSLVTKHTPVVFTRFDSNLVVSSRIQIYNGFF